MPFWLLCLSSLCCPVNKLTVRPIALIHTPCGVQTPAAINIDKIVADLILCTLYTVHHTPYTVHLFIFVYVRKLILLRGIIGIAEAVLAEDGLQFVAGHLLGVAPVAT